MAMCRPIVRASKFRHVYGNAWNKSECYTVKVPMSTGDSNLCSVNAKFLAVIVASRGGRAFIVLNLPRQLEKDSLKSDHPDHPVVIGHTGPVIDIAFSPHDEHLIASGSEDCTVKLWLIPTEGLTRTITEPLITLSYHKGKVGLLLWHPAAENVLLTAGSDHAVVIWDVETAIPNIVIECHPDVVYSASWNWDGSRVLTTCRDKKIRIINPRTKLIEQEVMCHSGTKPCRAIFLKDGLIFTTGFSYNNTDRQFSLRDPNNLEEPLILKDWDTSNGVLFPLYDPDTNLVYMCGKGDSVISYFEITAEAPYVHFLSVFQLQDPQRGIGMMVKGGVNVAAKEIARFYRLSGDNGLCQVISMTVPRKSEMFQNDLYPLTVSPEPALLAHEWFSGIDKNPLTMDLKTTFQIKEKNPHPHYSIPTFVRSQLRKTQSVLEGTSIQSMKEELISQSNHLIRLSSHVDHLEERVGFLETIIYENQIQILGNAMASSGSAQLIDLTDFESSNDN